MTLPPKLYFRIGEVSGLVGVEPHVLRYWEREFRTIRPTKSAKGQRVYSRRDVENLLKVRELLYTEGFTIAGARKRMREAPRPDGALDAPEAAESGGDGVLPDADVEARASAASVVARGSLSTNVSTTNDTKAAVLGQLREVRDELQAFLTELGG